MNETRDNQLKKSYTAPTVTVHGSVSRLTFGGSAAGAADVNGMGFIMMG